MTFLEVEDSLPNRFHDSTLNRCTFDYKNKRALLEFDIWMEQVEVGGKRTVIWLAGPLTVSGLHFAAVDSPHRVRLLRRDSRGSGIDSAPIQPGQCPAIDAAIAIMPDSSTAYRFYLEDINGFIYLAGEQAEFCWDGESQSK